MGFDTHLVIDMGIMKKVIHVLKPIIISELLCKGGGQSTTLPPG